jgi:quinol monooxygenase YgiN
MIERRGFVALSTAAIFGHRPLHAHRIGAPADMYGLIGKMLAVEGRRDELATILLEGIGGMPGCLSYVVANDAADDNALWITEVWDSQASHQASLTLPSVQDAIQQGRPLIAGFGERFETIPLGGHGLAEG